ncbi:hypothetical protein [Clostridium sp.]|uniref:hypothetical protein n=1 Tax=Clostridium sp. TaxID=1506 RepID=UPI003F2C7D53
MEMFNKFYRFGSEVKPKASLYSLGIVFFIAIVNLIFGITTISIFTLLETFIISLLIALLEYYFFHNYEDLSRKKNKTNTIIWAILSNLIVISSAVIFSWFPILPLLGNILLIIILNISIVAMRYSIYVVNLVDTKNLNSKLQKFQKTT